MTGDLRIYYNSLTGSDYIEAWCSRWDTDNYTMIVETWLTKSQLKDLRDNITPGATGELYKILGSPKYHDQTWDGSNTLKLSPLTTDNSNLDNMRSTDKIGYVKSIQDRCVKGSSGFINCKLELYISGGTL